MNRAKKIPVIFISLLMLSGFLLRDYSMAMSETLNPNDSLAQVPGKIVFQSNRNGALSEIWLLENGNLKKIAGGQKTEKDVPKVIPEPYKGIFAETFGDLSQPRLSPDGSKILCVAKEELLIMDTVGQEIQKIRAEKPVLLARWAPDGKGVYYTSADFQSGGGGSANIFKINLADNAEERITNLKPLPGVRRILNFAVSPDDKTIAMQIWGEKEQGISIWTIKTDGADLKLLVKFAGDPAWSPDGSKLVYVSRDLPSGEKIKFLEIFVLDMATGQTVRATNNNWEEHNPVFSPDGKQIAYFSSRHRVISYGSEIFLINIDGTGEARLTSPQPNPKFQNDPVRGWATDEYPDWVK